MRAKRLLAAIALGAACVPAAAAAATVERSEFRYERPLAAQGSAQVVFEPDGPLYAHARGGLIDLRIVDARGEQVAWRQFPQGAAASSTPVTVLNSGVQGGEAVALLDLGPERRIRDRVELEVAEQEFVGRVTVFGSDTRAGPFTRLGATGIYDIAGAQRARSTTVLFPPSDFRYLQLRATGIRRIDGATVSGREQRPRLVDREHRPLRVTQQGTETLVTADFGFRNLPVDELELTSSTTRYDRQIRIEGSNDGVQYRPITYARIFRFTGSVAAPIPVGTHHRYLRIAIENGDDEPLEGLELRARARSRAILVEGGHTPPFTLLYGDADARAPSYDFARLPTSALPLQDVVRGTLGREALNEAYEPPADTRSFVKKNPIVVQAALAVVAFALGVAGFLALRRRPAERP